jgi:hypothetical protein
VVLWLGQCASRRVATLDDFFLAGRKLGKAFQCLRSLLALAKAADAECATRGVKAPDKGPYFSYLDGIDGLLAEELRRASLPEPQMDAAAIAALARLPRRTASRS